MKCERCTHPERDHSKLTGCLIGVRSGEYCPCAGFVPTLAEAGRRLREEGMARAGTGVNLVSADAWRSKAREALDVLVANGQPFTADDVVELAGLPPHPNMLGPVFVACARTGRIHRVGYQPGGRASAHRRVQAVWQAVA